MVYKFRSIQSKIQLFTKLKNLNNTASYQGCTKAVPRLHHPRSFLASSFSPDFAFLRKKRRPLLPQNNKIRCFNPCLEANKRGHGISILQPWVSFLFPNLSREKKKRIQVNYLFSTYMVNNDGDRPVPGISSRFS